MLIINQFSLKVPQILPVLAAVFVQTKKYRNKKKRSPALLQQLNRWDSPTRTGKLFQVTASKTAAFTTFATPQVF